MPIKVKTAEEIAAAKSAKDARIATRKTEVAKGGQGAMVALLEGVAEGLNEKIESMGEGQEGIQDQIKGMIADLDSVKSKLRVRTVGAGSEGMDVEKFNVGKLIKAAMEKRMDDTPEGCGYELECIEQGSKGLGAKEMKKKDVLAALTGTSGGAPLPMQVDTQIQQAARSKTQLFDLGVFSPNLEGYSGFAVPTELKADGTAVTDGINMTPGSTREGGAIRVVRPGFGMVNFTPKKLAFIVGMTNDMLKMGGKFLHDYTMRVGGEDYANQLERLVLSGRGNGENEPMGILNRTDLTALNLTTLLGTGGRFLRWGDFSDFEMDLAEANRLTDTCAFYTRTAALRQLKTQAATYALAGADNSNSRPITDVQFASLKRIAEFVGYKIAWSTNVPKNFVTDSVTTNTAVAFGDWSKVWIPTWGPMEMLVTNLATVAGVSAFETDMFWTRFTRMYDSNIVLPSAMIVKKGFKTVA